MSEPTPTPTPLPAAPDPDDVLRLAHIAVHQRYGDTRSTRILVNGTDVAPHCLGVSLELGHGAQPATLTLDLASRVDLDMTGVVQLMPASDPESVGQGRAQAVVEWLDTVDVAAVEQYVLSSGMAVSPVASVLDALRALALRG